eukprot:PhM_4_TR4867/c0_g1_i1/m.59788
MATVTAQSRSEKQQHKGYHEEHTPLPRARSELSLLFRIQSGELPKPAAAAIGYVDDTLAGAHEALITEVLMEGKPVLSTIKHTPWGDIALVILPILQKDVLFEPKLVDMLLDAAKLCRTIGAKVMALTGLLPSATNYGTSLQLKMDLAVVTSPLVTTGHAVTTACIVQNIDRMLTSAHRRDASAMREHEHVAFLGLGSVGTATLRLFLAVLPHVASIALHDITGKAGHLRSLAGECRRKYKFRGEITIRTVEASARKCHESIYDATLIIGATSVADVLDIDRLRPGTIVVDDSAPHCFDVEAARRRMDTLGDVLITEGGPLRVPAAMRETQFLPRRWLQGGGDDGLSVALGGTGADAFEMMGCTLSALLSALDEELMPPTLGTIDPDVAAEAYRRLGVLGIKGCNMTLDDVGVPGHVEDTLHQKQPPPALSATHSTDEAALGGSTTCALLNVSSSSSFGSSAKGSPTVPTMKR